MKLYDQLVDKEAKLSLVGLGYVGMPIAVAFARKINVIGFDLNAKKIEMYKNGIDPTHEVGNEVMGKYCAENCVKNLIAADKAVKGAKVAILGFTFKENCPDTRNTKIIDIVHELQEYGITPVIADPEADATEAKMLYGVEFVDMSTIKGMDAVILAVAHTEFSNFTMAEMDKFFGEGKKVLLDLKGLLNRKEYEAAGYSYWRL